MSAPPDLNLEALSKPVVPGQSRLADKDHIPPEKALSDGASHFGCPHTLLKLTRNSSQTAKTPLTAVNPRSKGFCPRSVLLRGPAHRDLDPGRRRGDVDVVREAGD